MKTLVITYTYPLPENGGEKIRTMNFVRYFKRLGNVDILFYSQDELHIEIGHPFEKVINVDAGEGGLSNNFFVNTYEKIKYSKPWVLNMFSNKGIITVRDIVENGNYDCILCRYTQNAFPLFFLPQKIKDRVIVDIDDFITKELYKAKNKTFTGINRIKTVIDFTLYYRYQLKCAKMSKSLLCSEADKKMLKGQIPAEKTFIVPNVAPVFSMPSAYKKNGFTNINTILFVGNLAYKPNSEGIKWFITAIFTKAVSNGYHFELVIAGKEPDQQLREMCAANNNIKLADTPPDLVPFYERCGAVIVPLLNGGGTRIKILEAGYALRPVISTDVGAYGLDLTDYNDVLYANDYDNFIKRYEWLKEETNYSKVTANLNDFVTSNYSQSNFINSMDKAIYSPSASS